MPGKIPQAFIDQVLNQTDIVDLIGSYIEIKQKGKEYSACCPFHHEKTPSFTISSEKQFYHCFGCGAHGTAVGFLMEHEGLEFVESIETLANRIGLEVPHEASNHKESDSKQQYAALEKASKFFAQELRKQPLAIDYLKQRGITGEIAATFTIGYAPDGFNNISKQLGQEFSNDLLVKVGLLSKKNESNIYDRFRKRIIFPIKDTRGRVIAFGGRTLDGSDPKYLNSPETPVFHKSNTLYGLHEARKSPGRIPYILIVEGYMDVVALAQHGINNSVATLGTATTSEHLRLALRYTSNLVFCFDGDRAGNAAAWHALEHTLPIYTDGIDIKFAFMPTGEDPDSLIRQSGVDAFNRHIEEAIPLSEFFFSQLAKDIDLSTPDGCAKLANQAKPLLAKLPKSVFRDLMTKELNARVGTKVRDTNPLQATSQRDYSSSQTTKQAPRYTKTRLAIALLLRDPKLANLALDPEQLNFLQATPGINLLIHILDILVNDPHLSSVTLLERFRDHDDYVHLQKLLAWDPPDLGNREQTFKDIMLRFKQDISKVQLGNIIDKHT